MVDKKLTSEAELDGEILSSMEKSLNYLRPALVKSILSNKYLPFLFTFELRLCVLLCDLCGAF